MERRMVLAKKKSKINGVGIFTNSKMAIGDVFYIVPLEKIGFENKKRWAYIGNGKHVCDEKVLNYVNHSCSPNCELNISEERPFLRSLVRIMPGEEITVDYKKTEVEGLRFVCNCGSNNCFSKKILLISTCKEKMHELEFVKPIEDILKSMDVDFFVKNYRKISKKDLEEADRIIVCGTSLKDNEFLGYYHNFDFLLDFEKPVLGICAGMQIIGVVFAKKGEGNLFRQKTEIGFFREKFNQKFLGLSGEQDVYHLHNNYVKFYDKDFLISSGGNVVQAVVHKKKKIYGVLFHPEVRQKQMIMEFVKNG